MIRPLLPPPPATSGFSDPRDDLEDDELSWSSFGNDVYGGIELNQKCRLPRRHHACSDEQIERDLYQRLRDDPRLETRNLTLFACNGTLMLAGSVPARSMKGLIEDTAERCCGVLNVVSRLRVS